LAPRRFHAVVFDFDYTLVDSSRAVIACANYALGEMGLPLASDEVVCRTIGLPLPQVLVELAGEQERARGQDFQRLFVSLADKVGNALTVLLGPTAETIGALRGCGLRLGIVSTKMRYRMEGLLHREGLLADFDVIVGIEDVPVPKPDPTGLLMAIGRLQVAVQDCLYVGDSVVDAETASRAGVPFLAVLTGKTDRESLAAYPHVGIAGSVADVPGVVGCDRGRP
jgi:phosphoglycolate phosphatase